MRLEKCSLCRTKKRKLESKGKYLDFRIRKRTELGMARHWFMQHPDDVRIKDIIDTLSPTIFAINDVLNYKLDGKQSE